MQGNFEEAKVFVPEIIDGIKKYKDQIDEHHVMLFYYKIACLYFSLSDYENSIVYLNKIIKKQKYWGFSIYCLFVSLILLGYNYGF